MKLVVVDPANRDRELVAYPAAECARLGKGEVVRIRRHAPAHEAGLPEHEIPVIPVAKANRFAQGAL